MGWWRDRRVTVAVASVYLLGLVVLVAGPWGWALNRLTVRLYVLFRYDWPVAPEGAGPEDYGVILNVLLFIPVGALAVLLLRRPWWWVTAAAALGSAGIEVVQALFLAREGDPRDLVANTLGAAIGALGVSTLVRFRSRRAGRPT